MARLNCPPMRGEASKRETECPRRAATVAKASPAGPAPTTAAMEEEDGRIRGLAEEEKGEEVVEVVKVRAREVGDKEAR